mmetsp:Transcript_19006/g.16840  ORF Transcript_19006/g.16840 Transcript_19006/m.16840 type:complete len:157 (-) Transcript_19006:49-519(-)
MMNGTNPERVKEYNAKANLNGRSNKYEEKEEIKISFDKTKDNTMDKTRNQQKMTIKTIKEESEESGESKSSKDKELGKDSSLERDDLSSERQESDINDRQDWKMSDDTKTVEKASSDTNLQKVSNESPLSFEGKKDTIIARMEKAIPSEIDDASDY